MYKNIWNAFAFILFSLIGGVLTAQVSNITITNCENIFKETNGVLNLTYDVNDAVEKIILENTYFVYTGPTEFHKKEVPLFTQGEFGFYLKNDALLISGQKFSEPLILKKIDATKPLTPGVTEIIIPGCSNAKIVITVTGGQTGGLELECINYFFTVPQLTAGVAVSGTGQFISIVMNNTGSSAITIPANTIFWSGNGLKITNELSYVIKANSSQLIALKLIGTPIAAGSYGVTLSYQNTNNTTTSCAGKTIVVVKNNLPAVEFACQTLTLGAIPELFVGQAVNVVAQRNNYISVKNNGTTAVTFSKGYVLWSGNGLKITIGESRTLAGGESTILYLDLTGTPQIAGVTTAILQFGTVSNSCSTNLTIKNPQPNIQLVCNSAVFSNIPTLTVGVPVNVTTGNNYINVKNIGSASTTIPAGTVLWSGNGLKFTTRQALLVEAGATKTLYINIIGTPQTIGTTAVSLSYNNVTCANVLTLTIIDPPKYRQECRTQLTPTFAYNTYVNQYIGKLWVTNVGGEGTIKAGTVFGSREENGNALKVVATETITFKKGERKQIGVKLIGKFNGIQQQHYIEYPLYFFDNPCLQTFSVIAYYKL